MGINGRVLHRVACPEGGLFYSHTTMADNYIESVRYDRLATFYGRVMVMSRLRVRPLTATGNGGNLGLEGVEHMFYGKKATSGILRTCPLLRGLKDFCDVSLPGSYQLKSGHALTATHMKADQEARGRPVLAVLPVQADPRAPVQALRYVAIPARGNVGPDSKGNQVGNEGGRWPSSSQTRGAAGRFLSSYGPPCGGTYR